MKVTAIIPDELVSQLKARTKARTLTEGLITALREWIDMKSIQALNQDIEQEPFQFDEGFTHDTIRSLNRAQ